MRGGERFRRLAVVTAVSVAVGVNAGCGPERKDAASAAPATVSYEDWRPVYDDVRPATAADLEGMQERVHELNASSYTAVLDSFGAEVESTSDHVRVRFGEGGSGEFDLHLDPDEAVERDPHPYVVCFASEDSCVEVGSEASTGDQPHVFNNMIDSFVFILAGIVGSQRSLVDGLTTRDALSATLESPMGSLDCLVSGGTAADRADLQGQPVELSPDLVVREGDPFPVFPVCVDQHGLVIVAPSFMSAVVPYSSFESGVSEGMDEHPVPVPYGETPSPTPTPTETSASEAEAVQNVIVAFETIAVGESLLSAQQTGKLSLEFVSVDSLLPGAVDTTDGLQGVALAELPAGAQITEDTFGLPTMADLLELGVTEELYKAARQAAVRSDYSMSAPARPASDMRILAYRFAHRCQAVADGSTTWRRVVGDDVSDDSPSNDEAVELNDYLETSWCPAVLG